MIVSGSEDGRYKVWDNQGHQLFSSGIHDNPITTAAWSPNGDLFAVGSYNTLRLCDYYGVNHQILSRIIWFHTNFLVVQIFRETFDRLHIQTGLLERRHSNSRRLRQRFSTIRAHLRKKSPLLQLYRNSKWKKNHHNRRRFQRFHWIPRTPWKNHSDGTKILLFSSNNPKPMLRLHKHQLEHTQRIRSQRQLCDPITFIWKVS